MKFWIKNFFKKNSTFSPLIIINISKSALLHNINEFRKLTRGISVAPVLKSNAYGHGLSLIANILKKEDIPFFVIDSYFEARALRCDGIGSPLLVIGYSTIETIIENKLDDIRFTITSLDALEELDFKINKNVTIHLKIDTGMHRQGLSIDEIDKAFEIIKNNKKIVLEGICTHLGDADNQDTSYTDSQISIWNIIVGRTKEHFPFIKYWHVSNTAGHAFGGASANVTRLGIGLYGINYGARVESLVNTIPVLEMKTIITSVKKIKVGSSVGYSKNFIASQDMVIATIPVGYYEALNRKLSNKGFVKIGDSYAPIIGNISMNITTIDITNIPNVKRGDEVLVISRNKEDKNSVENISKISEVIPYEISIHIPAHLKRVIVE